MSVYDERRYFSIDTCFSVANSRLYLGGRYGDGQTSQECNGNFYDYFNGYLQGLCLKQMKIYKKNIKENYYYYIFKNTHRKLSNHKNCTNFNP